jgi:hypothetical protein
MTTENGKNKNQNEGRKSPEQLKKQSVVKQIMGLTQIGKALSLIRSKTELAIPETKKPTLKEERIAAQVANYNLQKAELEKAVINLPNKELEQLDVLDKKLYALDNEHTAQIAAINNPKAEQDLLNNEFQKELTNLKEKVTKATTPNKKYEIESQIANTKAQYEKYNSQLEELQQNYQKEEVDSQQLEDPSKPEPKTRKRDVVTGAFKKLKDKVTKPKSEKLAKEFKEKNKKPGLLDKAKKKIKEGIEKHNEKTLASHEKIQNKGTLLQRGLKKLKEKKQPKEKPGILDKAKKNFKDYTENNLVKHAKLAKEGTLMQKGLKKANQVIKAEQTKERKPINEVVKNAIGSLKDQLNENTDLTWTLEMRTLNTKLDQAESELKVLNKDLKEKQKDFKKLGIPSGEHSYPYNQLLLQIEKQTNLINIKRRAIDEMYIQFNKLEKDYSEMMSKANPEEIDIQEQKNILNGKIQRKQAEVLVKIKKINDSKSFFKNRGQNEQHPNQIQLDQKIKEIRENGANVVNQLKEELQNLDKKEY